MSTTFFRFVCWIVVLLLSGLAPGAGTPQGSNLNLMPVPQHLDLGQGRLPIDDTFTVHLGGHRDPRLPAAATRLLQRLQKKSGVPFALSPAAGPALKPGTLEIHCSGGGERIQSALADESYTLEIAGQNARLSAPSPIGVLHGLETFLQLADFDGQSFSVPSVKIEDRPRFRWRGLLVDVARHWEPVAVIRRNLDAMAAVKMNVFHWHLSDDQGFRMESRIYPKLHQVGAEGKYYTQGEVREIVAYARDRGIRVIPEFDMPGHTTAWLAAYPELASAPGPYSIERSWGVFDPCMDPTRNKLYSFLDAFVGEMARLFPDEYFHIGGDEVNGKQWNASSKIRSFKKRAHLQSNRDLQAYFNRRLLKILAKHGKKMIGWDEILHPDLPKSTVVQSWRGQASLSESARRGYDGILSYGYYLDHMRTAAFHYGMDPLGEEAADLMDKERTRILGGEACMWAEFVNEDNIESRIWPRTAAIAERLWSPAEVCNVQDMYRRLEYARGELDSLGVQHRSKYLERLQTMAGAQPVAPLKILADLLEPTGLGFRQRTRKYSSLTPLDRLVDAVLPESDAARRLGELAGKGLAGQDEPAGSLLLVRELLSLWRENGNQVKRILAQPPVLKEIEPLSETVAQLCERGLQALDYLESRQRPPETWQKETAALMRFSEMPQAELRVAIAAPIKALIDAANAIP